MRAEMTAMVVAGAGAVYLGLGVCCALALVARGLERLDPAARGSTWGFRLIVLPGLVALWPLVARGLVRASAPPVERNAHRRAAREVAP